MRYLIAACAALFAIPVAAEILPVHDEAGVLVGYVDTTADDRTDIECIPNEPKPYPDCITFADGGGDGDDDGSGN